LHDEKSYKESLSQLVNELMQWREGRRGIQTREIPTISSAAPREGFATAIPPAALVTETAGVRTPSAMVSPVAKRHWMVGLFKARQRATAGDPPKPIMANGTGSKCDRK
jgi:hypothetical protein